jgi:hypothetical protein
MADNLWPWHPHPRADEVFSSWFRNVSSGNGLSERELCSAVGLPSSSRLDDLEPTFLADGISLLGENTGVAVEKIYGTLVSHMERNLARTVSTVPHWKRPWLTRYEIRKQGAKHARTEKYASQFCARCMKESDFYWRLSWRFSLFVACLKHRCLLSPSSIDRPEYRSVSTSGYHLAMSSGSPVPHDGIDCGQLNLFPNLYGISVEIWHLEALHMKAVNDGRSQSYFEALHWLLNLILLKEDHIRWIIFELCSPKQRYDLLVLVLHCFRHWPTVPFLSAELRDHFCSRAEFQELPLWFREACSMEAGTSQERKQESRLMLRAAAEQEGWSELADFLLHRRLPNWSQLRESGWSPGASEPDFCEDGETYS